jgi:dihydrofolate synthase/folylpolyglutamate synthase
MIGQVAAVEELAGVNPSYFEILTAGAFTWFAQEAVDVAVVEVGLLGEWDATNVVDSQVAVITNISKDHTDGSGDWRVEVAREKAGIVKPGSTLVLGETAPDLRAVFDERPRAGIRLRDVDFGVGTDLLAVGGRSVDLYTPLSRLEDLFVPLHGSHQVDNAAVAVQAVEAFFDRALDESLVREAVGSVTIPGRFEIVGRNPLVVLDGAHNPQGAAAASRTLDDFDADRRVFVLGFLQGRDPAEMLRAFGVRPDDLLVACEPAWPRALPASEIAAASRASGADVEVEPRVDRALARGRDMAGANDAVLVSGSLYVVGEARALLI